MFHAPIAKPKPPPAAAAADGGKGGEKGGDGAQQWAFSVEDKDGQVWELRAESEHDFYVWSQQLRAWRAGEKLEPVSATLLRKKQHKSLMSSHDWVKRHFSLRPARGSGHAMIEQRHKASDAAPDHTITPEPPPDRAAAGGKPPSAGAAAAARRRRRPPRVELRADRRGRRPLGAARRDAPDVRRVARPCSSAGRRARTSRGDAEGTCCGASARADVQHVEHDPALLLAPLQERRRRRGPC